MGAIETAQRYFDAWNRQDPQGVAATFVDGGWYEDPTTKGKLTGDAIADSVSGLLTMFPDLSFDVVSVAQTGDNTVAAQWLMKGTNTGPLPGGPPMGRTIALPGSDFIEVDGDSVRSVLGYFDQVTLFEQLGLAANPMPAEAIGPISFGGGVLMHAGKDTKPGAFTITSLNVRSDEERNKVQEISQQIAMEMFGMPGFLAFSGLTFGHRMITLTAWEDETGPDQLLGSPTHKTAAKNMYRGDFTLGGMLSVWAPTRIRMLVRCEECGQMADRETSETCQAGHKLPVTERYL
ncbi:MAG: nuclear transport factor 2 family protein [Actinomycetota bacterium]